MAERENKYMLSGTVELDDTYVGATESILKFV